MEGGVNCELASGAAVSQLSKDQISNAASEARPVDFAPGAARVPVPKGHLHCAASGAEPFWGTF